MNDLKLLDSAMKTPGGIESRFVKCGKPGCKCAKGKLHGPYFYYRYWKLSHKVWVQKKRYVTCEQAERLSKAIKNYKEVIRFAGEDHYRKFRKGVRFNVLKGMNGMTQRKLAKVTVLVKSFA